MFNKSANKVKIIPIGGLSFIGANCTAIQYDNDIIVIDAGLGFPTADQLGVDYVIPNSRFFKQNPNKVNALIITHGHLDHIGALPKIIEDMGLPPIFVSPFAKELILDKFKYDAPDLIPKLDFKIIHRDSIFKVGQTLEISMFGVNHSIPESMGVVISTPVGRIVHTGDFKFDNAPINEPQADYAKIANIGLKGVLCLLSDSTNSYVKGYAMSESEITIKLSDLIEDIDGRVIVATFSSMVNRLLELIKIAVKQNRKVFISGRSMERALNIAQKIGYAKFPEHVFINASQLKNYKDNEIMILATGAQGEDLAALRRIAKNNHKDIKIKKGDSVVLSASIIPGNGAVVQSLIDELSKLGANVFHSQIMNLHTTGHGHQGDQKLMINLVKPKYFMPIHGFYSFLFEHAKTAMELGIPEKNIIIVEDGEVVEIDHKGWNVNQRVDAKPVIVSGIGVGDVGDTVLEDRQQLANFGVVVYELIIDKVTKELKAAPEVNSRGFVYMKQSKELINDVVELIQTEYNRNTNKNNLFEVNQIIKSRLKKFLYKTTEREPVILSFLKEV